MSADSVVILDFETTGLSPQQGERAIEIGAVRIKHGEVVDRFQALMNPGRRIDPFIESYTGISNAMLRGAPSCEEVMNDFADYIADDNLVAHNSAFDKRFLDAELKRISRTYSGQFACSLLVARRVLQSAPNHKLGTLIRYMNIPSDGGFHRALYDSEMTAKLWLAMLENITQRSGLSAIPFAMMLKIMKTPKRAVEGLLKS